MQLAVVQGRATATIKHRSLAAKKLLICQMLGCKRDPVGDPVLVVDRLGAGWGDHVILSSDGLGLRNLLSDHNSPVRWWTLAIVDQVQIND